MKLRLFSALVLLPLVANADALYKCTDDAGHILYTNQKNASKNCALLSRDQPISTFTPPPKSRATPGDFPRVNADQQKARDNDRRAILEQELGNEQRLLDEAKKAVAEQENSVEPSERFHTAKGGGINSAKVEERLQPYRDSVQLHERNIASLKKEISNLR